MKSVECSNLTQCEHDRPHSWKPQTSGHAATRAFLPGFTLIEVLLATAISGALVVMLVAIIMQLFQVTIQSTSRMAVLGDLTLATQSLARDINSASIVTVADAHHLTLTQPDPQGGAARTVAYSVEPPLLTRNGQTVARYTTTSTAFSPLGIITGTQMVTLRIVATLGSESQQQTVQFGLRPQP